MMRFLNNLLKRYFPNRVTHGQYVATTEYQEILPDTQSWSLEACKEKASLEFEKPWSTLEKGGVCIAKVNLEYVCGFRAKTAIAIVSICATTAFGGVPGVPVKGAAGLRASVAMPPSINLTVTIQATHTLQFSTNCIDWRDTMQFAEPPTVVSNVAAVGQHGFFRDKVTWTGQGPVWVVVSPTTTF